MNIIEKEDVDIYAIANPFWRELVKSSNEGNYGSFAKISPLRWLLQ